MSFCDADWDPSPTICGGCNGNGCGTCRHTGEVVTAPVLLHVSCICGWDCDGRKFRAAMLESNGRCPECERPIEDAVEEQRPEDVLEDDDGPDYDSYDLPEWSPSYGH